MVLATTPITAALYMQYAGRAQVKPNVIYLHHFHGLFAIRNGQLFLPLGQLEFRINLLNLPMTEDTLAKLVPADPRRAIPRTKNRVNRLEPDEKVVVLQLGAGTVKMNICSICILVAQWSQTEQCYKTLYGGWHTNGSAHWNRHCERKYHEEDAMVVLSLRYVVSEPWECPYAGCDVHNRAYSSATDHLKLHLPNSYTPQDWKTAKKELKDASERFVEDELRAHGALEDYEEAPAPPQVPEPTEDVHAEPLPTPIVELHNDDASGPHDDEYDDELVFEDQQFTGPIHPPFVDANSDKANDATKTQAASPEFKIDFDFPTQAEDDFDPFPVVPGPQLTEHKELPHGDVYLNEPFALADEAPDSPVLVPLDTMPDDFLVPEPAPTQIAGQKRDRDDTDDEELSDMDGEEQQRDERPSYEVTSPMKRRRFNEF